jgi:hypothetical protein
VPTDRSQETGVLIREIQSSKGKYRPCRAARGVDALGYLPRKIDSKLAGREVWLQLDCSDVSVAACRLGERDALFLSLIQRKHCQIALLSQYFGSSLILLS